MVCEDHHDNITFLRHPKVVKARRLLVEAAQEIRQKVKVAHAKEFCGCGHIRKVHGPAHSINYTGGACLECRCLNFLARSAPRFVGKM